MPLQQCQVDGVSGLRWGRRGHCYTGPNARRRALAQASAMHARGWREPTTNALRPRVNPLRLDPSRTGLLRRAFERDLMRRFDVLKRKIIDLVAVEDAFGLVRKQLFFNVANKRWIARTTPEQVKSFQMWLASQVQQDIIPSSPQEAEEAYWREYIEQGYRKGAGRAFDDARKPYAKGYAADESTAAFYRGTKQEFLASAFSQAESVEKIKLLAGRVFTDLNGVTTSMATAMSRTLTDGLTQGKNPRVIARELVKSVDGIGKVRARMIARTECLPGETLVDGAVIRAIFRRWYDGPMIEITTCSSRKFSATPNHPMLTERGWVAAGQLQEGDKLIRHNRQKDSRSASNSDVVQGPATLGEIYRSLSAIGVKERVRCSQDDFHGDGVKGQVDILRPYRQLTIGRFSSLSKPLMEQVFTPAGKATSRFCPECGRLLAINHGTCLLCRSQLNPLINQSPSDDIAINFKRGGDPADRLSVAVATRDASKVQVSNELVGDPAFSPGEECGSSERSADSFLSENFTDLLLLGPDSNSDLPLTQPREVEFDDVLSVTVRPFSGHVYNLQTPFGYYTIDSLYTGNTMRAHNEGQLDAFQRLGVERLGVEVEWTVAGGACPLCAAMGGSVMSLAEARGMIPRHPNAVFAGSSFASYGHVQELVRAWYDGPAIVLLAGNKWTTIGPNHPMLTRRGMTRAAELKKGDEILYDVRCDLSGASEIFQVDHKQIPVIENVFETSFCCQPHTMVATSSSDLHGDRIFCQGEVQAIRPAGSLLIVLDSCGIEQLREGDFVFADAQSESPSSLGSGQFGRHRISLAASGNVGCSDIGVAADDYFVWLTVRHIEYSRFKGYAFDATTASSLYCSDGFVVSNCVCAWIPAGVGESTVGQTRGKEAVEGAIDESIRREMPKGRLIAGEGQRYKSPETGQFTLTTKRTLGEQKRRTTWAGPDKVIGKVRAIGQLDRERRLATLPVGRRAPLVECGVSNAAIVLHRKTACRVLESRAVRARATHKPSTVAKQRFAEANERQLASQVKAKAQGDNLPMDLVLQEGKHEHGIELKTMLDNSNNKITMHPDSRQRKEAWAAAQANRAVHTVLLDDRKRFMSGKYTRQYSGNRIYYARGVGAFRLGSMTPLKSTAELRQFITASDAELARLLKAKGL